MNTNKLKLFLRKIPKFLISLFVEMLEEKFSRKLFCLPLCQLLEVQISVHENCHYPFPEESKNIHTESEMLISISRRESVIFLLLLIVVLYG